MPTFKVLFRVAAGPQIGFGHLIRCRSLARAADVTPLVSLRGTEATRDSADAMGFELVSGSAIDAILATRPSVVVVDDPSSAHVKAWVHASRHAGVPVATIHDLGLGRVEDMDLAIDASDPRYTILDPAIYRASMVERRAPSNSVLIALGGGAHVRELAGAIACALTDREPDVDVIAASGFTHHALPLLACGTWAVAHHGLVDLLTQATIAITAGGVTAYEACALGVPAVSVAVAPAQHLTIRALADHGAVIDGGFALGAIGASDAIADAAIRLLRNSRLQKALSCTGRSVIDARGAFRVADALRQLASGGARHAA